MKSLIQFVWVVVASIRATADAMASISATANAIDGVTYSTIQANYHHLQPDPFHIGFGLGMMHITTDSEKTRSYSEWRWCDPTPVLSEMDSDPRSANKEILDSEFMEYKFAVSGQELDVSCCSPDFEVLFRPFSVFTIHTDGSSPTSQHLEKQKGNCLPEGVHFSDQSVPPPGGSDAFNKWSSEYTRYFDYAQPCKPPDYTIFTPRKEDFNYMFSAPSYDDKFAYFKLLHRRINSLFLSPKNIERTGAKAIYWKVANATQDKEAALVMAAIRIYGSSTHFRAILQEYLRLGSYTLRPDFPNPRGANFEMAINASAQRFADRAFQMASQAFKACRYPSDAKHELNLHVKMLNHAWEVAKKSKSAAVTTDGTAHYAYATVRPFEVGVIIDHPDDVAPPVENNDLDIRVVAGNTAAAIALILLVCCTGAICLVKKWGQLRLLGYKLMVDRTPETIGMEMSGRDATEALSGNLRAGGQGGAQI